MRNRVPHTQGPARDVRFCLMLPRESLSIPVMRRVLGDTLSRLGLDEDSIADLLLAVTEACTNVVRHAGSGHRYEVVAHVGHGRCVLQVLDQGSGFRPDRVRISRRVHLRRPPVRQSLLRRRAAAPSSADIAQLAESGRGLAIMRACVDDVSLHTGPGRGTVVQLRKRIELREGAPLAELGGSWVLKNAS
jgi:serine/threonine-protein kinase RsbW